VTTAMAAMSRLNRDAAEALAEIDERTPETIHAVTDVTGSRCSATRARWPGKRVSLEIDHAAIEYLPGAIAAHAQDSTRAGQQQSPVHRRMRCA